MGRGGMAAARLIAPLLFLQLLASTAVTEAAWGGAGTGGRWLKRQKAAEPPPPGSIFFHEGDAPLAWDNDELSRVRNLHARSFHDATTYADAPDLAAYLGLGQVEALHMPVPLNIVLVGFSGDGNMGVDIAPDVLTNWLDAVDAVLPHTRVSLSELSCSEDGHCAGQMEGSLPPSPLASTVHLNFSANVVVLQKGAVLGAFERAITAFSRPLDPEVEGGHQQVDALKMEAFVQSFVDALGLANSGYTLLVINPHWSSTLPAYGYRVGFSAGEVEMLAAQMEQLRSLSAALADPEPRPPLMPPPAGTGFLTGRAHSGATGVSGRMGPRKLSVSFLESESSTWAARIEAYLAQEEEHRRKVLRLLGPRTGGQLAVRRAVELMRHMDEYEVGQLLAATLSVPVDAVHNARFRAAHPLEDCATPAWVGHGRWMLLDLSAYRADYGPALGGDGVVSHGSLPDVNYAFQEAESERAAARDARLNGDAHEQGLKDELHVRHSQRVAQVAQRQAHAEQMHGARMRGMVQGGHGGAPGGAPTNPDGVAVGESMEEISSRHQEALLQAELDVYEEFALQHCQSRHDPPAVCAEAKEAATELRHELQLLAQHSTRPASAHRHHGWDIFGAADADDTPGSAAAAAHGAAVDSFLAELAAVLSRATRHVIAPPTATWRHDGYMHESATPYAQRVHFAIYTVRDGAHERRAGTTEPAAAFDPTSFSNQLSRLALPGQSFSYAHHDLALLDDAQLATAFSVSTRTTFAEVPHAVADPVGNEVHYVDSKELAARLRARFPAGAAGGRRAAHADVHHTLEVPVFVFLMARDVPVLIDEVYNARALEDMVLVVSNAAHQDEQPTGMMCDGVLLSRPLSPLKHALAATLQHLGGVLSPHLGYQPERKLVTHDWLWAVGAHPLSWTSFGAQFSQMHIDALHRSYLLDAIDASAMAVNRGVARLQHQKPDAVPFAHVQRAAPQLRRALQLYAQLVNLWRAAMAQAALLNYGVAAESIPDIEAAARAFEDACHEAFVRLYQKSCANRTALPAAFIGALLAGSALTAVVALLVVCAPRRKPKRI